MDRKVYAYGRVSTREQNLDRQMAAFREYGIPSENIFVDKQSGKDFNRPAYKDMLKTLTAGDTLVINIILSYLIQSHLWVQSSKALAIWGFGDFFIYGHKASYRKVTRCR